ncbi:MAG: hypothetical protein QOD39_1770, partial [Mycobacterium sp.]|nr:hypothetical protein [Mycobacterium sp.]
DQRDHRGDREKQKRHGETHLFDSAADDNLDNHNGRIIPFTAIVMTAALTRRTGIRKERTP